MNCNLFDSDSDEDWQEIFISLILMASYRASYTIICLTAALQKDPYHKKYELAGTLLTIEQQLKPFSEEIRLP